MNRHSSCATTPVTARPTTSVCGRRWLLTLIALATVPTLAAAQPTTQVVEYYHTDALGSVRAVTKKVGTEWVATRHDFLPFGEEVAPPPPPSDKRLFTGKERDSETGMDYFEARYLRASVGRFTTVDPLLTIEENLVDPQRWNRYSHVRSNPLTYVDPDGRYTNDCATGDVACNEQALRFEEARQRNLKRRSTRDSAEAYGRPGEDNGVHVHFNVPEQGGYDDGIVDPSGSTPMNPNINVWIKPSVTGNEFDRLVAHEGSHVGDMMAFVESGFDPRLNLTNLETESRAFAIGASVMPYTRTTVCGSAPCTFTFGPTDAKAIRAYLLASPRYSRSAYDPMFLIRK